MGLIVSDSTAFGRLAKSGTPLPAFVAGISMSGFASGTSASVSPSFR